MTGPTAPRAPFWFLRHGVTDLNAKGITQGRIDAPLNEAGSAQARVAARLLQGCGVAGIATSPMARTRQTAAIVAELLGGLPVVTVPGLEERDWGAFEGLPRAGRPDVLEGDRVEPWDAFVARTVRALEEALARGPAPLLVVAHAGTCRAVRTHLGLDHDRRSPVPHGRPLLFAPDEGGRWQERRCVAAGELDADAS